MKRANGVITTISCIAFAVLFSFSTTHASTNGPVLHYTFDADSGSVVLDQSGNGNHGAVSGAQYSQVALWAVRILLMV